MGTWATGSNSGARGEFGEILYSQICYIVSPLSYRETGRQYNSDKPDNASCSTVGVRLTMRSLNV